MNIPEQVKQIRKLNIGGEQRKREGARTISWLKNNTEQGIKTCIHQDICMSYKYQIYFKQN